MTVRFLAIAAIVVSTGAPSVLHAQSCPVADSIFGAKTRGKTTRSYDKMTDTTTVRGAQRGEINTLKDSDERYAWLAAQWQGQAPTTLRLSLWFKYVTSTSGGAAGTRRRSLSKDDAILGDEETAFVLVDDSVRLRLLRYGYAVKHNPAKVFSENLEETLAFDISAEQVLAIAKGTTVAIRVGEKNIEFKKGEIGSAAEIWRIASCAGAQ